MPPFSELDRLRQDRLEALILQHQPLSKGDIVALARDHLSDLFRSNRDVLTALGDLYDLWRVGLADDGRYRVLPGA